MREHLRALDIKWTRARVKEISEASFGLEFDEIERYLSRVAKNY